ncbi:hypothetical protein RUND412_000154 [Rhizina undulata]
MCAITAEAQQIKCIKEYLEKLKQRYLTPLHPDPGTATPNTYCFLSSGVDGKQIDSTQNKHSITTDRHKLSRDCREEIENIAEGFTRDILDDGFLIVDEKDAKLEEWDIVYMNDVEGYECDIV